eukprot:2092418-Prorocentrum_lima.AAC.1
MVVAWGWGVVRRCKSWEHAVVTGDGWALWQAHARVWMWQDVTLGQGAPWQCRSVQMRLQGAGFAGLERGRG